MIDNSAWVILDAFIFFLLALSPCLMIKRVRSELHLMRISSSIIYLYIIGIIIYCVVDRTDGDYFHLKEEIASLTAHPNEYSGIEPLYRFIGTRVYFSYSLFRLIIWGSAFVLYCKCLKITQALSLQSLWLFVLIALPYFSYPRVSLAISVYLLGFISFFKLRKYYIGIALFIVAYWLHKSIFILLLLTPLCYINMTYVRVGLFLILSLILSTVLSRVIVFFLEMVSGREGLTVMRYVTLSQSMGIAEIIQSFLFWIPSILILYQILSDKLFLESNLWHKRMLSLIFVIIYLSLIVQFCGIGTKFIYTRIREFSILPLCVLSSCYLRQRRTTLSIQVYMLLYLVSDFYYMCYRYYLKIIGTGI